VSAVSVAPDGRRVALVSGGRVYVAPLQFPASSDGPLSIGEPREVVTSLTVQRAVGWGSETSLVVGGDPVPGTPHSLSEVTIDGVREQQRPDTGSQALVVTALTTRPANPLAASPVPAIMFEANNIAYDVFGRSVDALKVDATTPAPSAAPGLPNAPFFPD
jgi:hypothetical protein